MNETFLFLSMLFCHIVDDYYLQGWLASAKQQAWWQEHAPQERYKHDYSCALLIHGISWSFMVMLPIAISQSFQVSWKFAPILICNAILHGFVDHLKANLHITNLWQDQMIHLIQLSLIWRSFVG